MQEGKRGHIDGQRTGARSIAVVRVRVVAHSVGTQRALERLSINAGLGVQEAVGAARCLCLAFTWWFHAAPRASDYGRGCRCTGWVAIGRRLGHGAAVRVVQSLDAGESASGPMLVSSRAAACGSVLAGLFKLQTFLEARLGGGQELILCSIHDHGRSIRTRRRVGKIARQARPRCAVRHSLPLARRGGGLRLREKGTRGALCHHGW